MPQRLFTTRLGALSEAAPSATLLALAREAASVTDDRFEVYGWLHREESGRVLFLARERSSGALVGLRLTPEGSDAAGDEQYSLAVVRQFNAGSLPLGGECDNCGAPLTGWELHCERCGFATAGAAERAAVGATREELLREVQRAAAPRFEVLGEVPKATGGGLLYFARETATERLAALRLTPDPAESDALFRLGYTTLFDAATLSPHSGPVGPLGGEGPKAEAPPAEPPAVPTRDATEPEATERKKVCPNCRTEYEADARFCVRDGAELRFVDQAEPLVGEVVAGRYRVLRLLGEGGMGRVYLAEHLAMGRLNALKVMLPRWAADVDMVKRFRREAANAGRVRHPNVAAVYDFAETGDGGYYIAMEYVEGPTLRAVLDGHGALPVERAVEIARQVAAALQAAHRQTEPIVHRDLKPDNVLLATEPGEDPLAHGAVKVVDFGIARAMGDPLQKVSRTGLVVGTPLYMSPEQFAGEDVDPRSDVYALGCVLYEMLTGQTPFSGESLEAILNEKLFGEAPRPRLKRSDIPEWLDDAVGKALARNPAERFQTADEFRTRLGERAETNSMAPSPKAEANVLRLSPPPSVSREPARRESDGAPHPRPEVPLAEAPAQANRAPVGAILLARVLGVLLVVVGIALAIKELMFRTSETARIVTTAGADTGTRSDTAITGDTDRKTNTGKSSDTGMTSPGPTRPAAFIDDDFEGRRVLWSGLSKDSLCRARYAGGGYYIENRNTERDCGSYHPVHLPANVRIEAEMLYIDGGDPELSYGLTFGLPSVGREGAYHFSINQFGKYMLSRYSNEYWRLIIAWRESNALREGAESPNRLAVEIRGGDITLYANGRRLGEHEAQADVVGRAGLEVNGMDVLAQSPSKVKFGYLRATRLP